MRTITREQRKAIKRVFDRRPLVYGETGGLIANPTDNADGSLMTYRQFRDTIQYGFDYIMLPWCGMWLGIETDGYTHS